MIIGFMGCIFLMIILHFLVTEKMDCIVTLIDLKNMFVGK